MSDEYTPTTGDVRVAWMAYHIDATDESPMPMSGWSDEFDRWLAAHDREVAEAVVVRIAESVQNHWRNP